MTYQPSWIIYEIQFRTKAGKWCCEHAGYNDLLMAFAECQHNAAQRKSVPWRLVKNDLRPNDPARDCSYLKPAVLWVSAPTFPEHSDYWKP